MLALATQPALLASTMAKTGAVGYDSYGMPLVGLTDAEASARLACRAREESQDKLNKWKAAACWQPSSGTAAPQKLKELARTGIPKSLRPERWLQLSGGQARKESAPPDYFKTLLSTSAPEALNKAQIAQFDTDLYKSFAGQPLPASLKAADVLLAVRRVILAAARHNTEAHYGQGAFQAATFLLIVLGLNHEEDAFFILLALTEDRNCITQGVNGCSVEQRVLEDLLLKRSARLLAVFSKLECPTSRLTGDWFLSLFTRALPFETTARVWDCMMCEGPKVLFRVALALLKMNEPYLLNAHHSTQVERVLQWRTARTYNTDALFKVAFKGIGSLSGEAIRRCRLCKEAAMLEELAAHRRRLESVLRLSGPAAPDPSAPAPFLPRKRSLETISEGPIQLYDDEESSAGEGSESCEA